VPSSPAVRKTAVIRLNSVSYAASASGFDPPPLRWSDLRYVFDIKEDCKGKEAIQA
jgi:hypothetical protein